MATCLISSYLTCPNFNPNIISLTIHIHTKLKTQKTLCYSKLVCKLQDVITLVILSTNAVSTYAWLSNITLLIAL